MASGLLQGLFCDELFEIVRLQLDPGDALLLYTDGITEAQDEAGNEFGRAQLSELCSQWHELTPLMLIRACLDGLSAFQRGGSQKDDQTLLVIQRTGERLAQ